MFFISLVFVCLAVSVKTDSCSLKPDGDSCTPKCSGSLCEQDTGKCCREMCLPKIDFMAKCDMALNKFLNTTIGNAINRRKRRSNEGKASPDSCSTGYVVDFLQKNGNDWQFECGYRGYNPEDIGYMGVFRGGATGTLTPLSGQQFQRTFGHLSAAVSYPSIHGPSQSAILATPVNDFELLGTYCDNTDGDYTWEATLPEEVMVGVQVRTDSNPNKLCVIYTTRLTGLKKTDCWGFTKIINQDSTGFRFTYRIPTGNGGTENRAITGLRSIVTEPGYREWYAKTCKLVECENDC